MDLNLVKYHSNFYWVVYKLMKGRDGIGIK